MSTELQSDRVRSADYEMLAGKKEEQFTSEALSGASYAIGKTLGEVFDDVDMNLNDLLLAAAMCFWGLFSCDSKRSFSLNDVLSLGSSVSGDVRKSLEKLVLAGFVEVDRSDGAQALKYELLISR